MQGPKPTQSKCKFASWQASHVNGFILASLRVKNTKDITYTKAKIIEVFFFLKENGLWKFIVAI
jgi:hypothetical protein